MAAPLPSETHEIGATGIRVTTVAMGCWPITGMTSIDVHPAESRATLRAALEAGINFFDSAYCYGRDGESERMLGELPLSDRHAVVVATKGGIHWSTNGERQFDARPDTLRRELHASLRRLGRDSIDLYYLHAPDPATPLEDSAATLAEFRRAGKVRAIGVSNLSLPQLHTFHAHCPVDAIQPPYNMLQRSIEADLLPWCGERSISVFVYWPLMKGLLAGKLPREHVFAPEDGRAKYPMFSGEEWQKNQDFLDELRAISAESAHTVAQLVIRWTLDQPHISGALCGAKRPYQIRETAESMRIRLSEQQSSRIAEALARRGVPVTRPAV